MDTPPATIVYTLHNYDTNITEQFSGTFFKFLCFPSNNSFIVFAAYLLGPRGGDPRWSRWCSPLSMIVAESPWMLECCIARHFYKNSNSQTLLKLYLAYVRSHLEYCLHVWSPSLKGDIDIVEAVQKYALRLFDLEVKIQYQNYTSDKSTDVNVPTPWIAFLCQYSFQGRYIPPTGGGGDSRNSYIASISEAQHHPRNSGLLCCI